MDSCKDFPRSRLFGPFGPTIAVEPYATSLVQGNGDTQANQEDSVDVQIRSGLRAWCSHARQLFQDSSLSFIRRGVFFVRSRDTAISPIRRLYCFVKS